MAQMQLGNPNATNQQCVDAHNMLLLRRQKLLVSAANHLPNMVQQQSLTLLEQSRLNTMAENDDAEGIYEFIMESVDLAQGKAQDLIRAKYQNGVELKPTDSMAVVIKQIEMKHYLWSKNTLFDHDSIQSQREGVRQILELMLAGPPQVANMASLAMTNVDGMAFPADGISGWVEALSKTYDRYARTLSRTSNGSL